MKRSLAQLIKAGIFVQQEIPDEDFYLYEVADGYQVHFKGVEEDDNEYTLMDNIDADIHGNATLMGPCGLEHSYEMDTHITTKHKIKVYKVTEIKSI